MTDPTHARNDTDDTTADEDGQLANPGPVPAAPEDSSDTGEGRPGDLAAEAGPDQDDDGGVLGGE
ncbi:hypothetical protein [Aeromicrobium chenweiae]|uniref:Uncharacterized protein n=1 Tax=Aeromicrobium chenweiae TaxID=2079793 RepID=A0A2S0WP82_9ACTN|nr:hypothetical protein [Aeromicrobium chenweiae]AWB93054.1 hypothetical protein C3E78_13025 [Aeromicrobium chenweiae]TGN34044.1 hypothetical protein E4L97_03060 [Aeromicrobium chenweiae]